MSIEELKQIIEQRTGVPASLLTGETAEENIAQAKAILAYKRDLDTQTPRTAQDQFAEWLNASQGKEAQDTAGAALAEIEDAARMEAGGYPAVQDSGEAAGLPDPRPARDQFAEWFGQKSAFNPFKGW